MNKRQFTLRRTNEGSIGSSDLETELLRLSVATADSVLQNRLSAADGGLADDLMDTAIEDGISLLQSHLLIDEVTGIPELRISTAKGLILSLGDRERIYGKMDIREAFAIVAAEQDPKTRTKRAAVYMKSASDNVVNRVSSDSMIDVSIAGLCAMISLTLKEAAKRKGSQRKTGSTNAQFLIDCALRGFTPMMIYNIFAKAYMLKNSLETLRYASPRLWDTLTVLATNDRALLQLANKTSRIL